MNNTNELDELPELTEEIRNEIIASRNTDLHLGAAKVQDNPWTKDPEWWIKRYGPEPLGIGIKALDILIFLLSFI